MDDFEWGRTFGRFFIAFIKNEDFFGIGIRIGNEYAIDAPCEVFHLTLQFGYLQFTMGIAEEEV